MTFEVRIVILKCPGCGTLYGIEDKLLSLYKTQLSKTWFCPRGCFHRTFEEQHPRTHKKK